MNILIIDDHPMIVQAYLDCFSDVEFWGTVPTFTIASDCKEAFAIIDRITDVAAFDLALIDQRLPAYPEENIFCGADLALLLKDKNTKCKTIMITSHSEVLIVYDLQKRVQPNGLINKGDVDIQSLRQGILQVLDGKTFHSSKVRTILQAILKKDLMLDVVNRQILDYLHKGYKIKDIQVIVSLSMSAIQRRIAQMKDAFNVGEASSLVKEALQQGFL